MRKVNELSKPKSKKKEVKTKAVAKIQKKEVKTKTIQKKNNSDALIELAINKDLDLDRMERLIEMREREEAKYAEKEFHIHFAKLQADLQPIYRNKKGYSNYYSTLAQIKRSVDPVVARHGFSYYWERSKIDRNDMWMETEFVLVGYGHVKRTIAEGAILKPSENSDGRSRMNPLQAIQATQTYLRRYSMMDGLGLSSDDDDIDGAGRISEPKISKELSAIRDSLWELYKDMGRSRKFGSDEMTKFNNEFKKNENDLDELKQMLINWNALLDERKDKK